MITWLILFKKEIPVYSENHTKSASTICGQNGDLPDIKESGRLTYVVVHADGVR
jgi:hypothetical protein